jgi:hypothetical protein
MRTAHICYNGYYHKDKKNKKCWKECEENGTLSAPLMGCKSIEPLWKTTWKFLKRF